MFRQLSKFIAALLVFAFVTPVHAQFGDQAPPPPAKPTKPAKTPKPPKPEKVESPFTPVKAPTSGEQAGWAISKKTLFHKASGMAVPTQLGQLGFASINPIANSQPELDTIIEFKSKDENAQALLHVFLPTLGDEGLASIAGDNSLRRIFGAATQISSDRLMPVGGATNGARVIEYQGGALRGQEVWVGAAFFKAGHWIVSARIVTPLAQAGMGRAALASLLKSPRFSSDRRPFPFRQIKLSACADDGKSALAQPVNIAPDAMGAQLAMISGIDFSTAKNARGEAIAVHRVPDALCVMDMMAPGGTQLIFLRPLPTGEQPFITDIGLIVLINDGGAMLEVSRADLSKPASYVTIVHAVGTATVLSYVDRPHAKGQVVEMISKPDSALNAQRGRYTIDAAGSPTIYVRSSGEQGAN